jgi:DNA-binding PadR family transcriptional regulator
LAVVNSPLREPTFLILTALAGEPLHGYAVISEVAELSQQRLTLRPGTLYGALDRLTDDGLVTVDREEIVDGRLRRYYRLTDAGDAALRAEVERMRHNADAATARLGRRDQARHGAPGARTSGARPAGARTSGAGQAGARPSGAGQAGAGQAGAAWASVAARVTGAAWADRTAQRTARVTGAGWAVA